MRTAVPESAPLRNETVLRSGILMLASLARALAGASKAARAANAAAPDERILGMSILWGFLTNGIFESQGQRGERGKRTRVVVAGAECGRESFVAETGPAAGWNLDGGFFGRGLELWGEVCSFGRDSLSKS